MSVKRIRHGRHKKKDISSTGRKGREKVISQLAAGVDVSRLYFRANFFTMERKKIATTTAIFTCSLGFPGRNPHRGNYQSRRSRCCCHWKHKRYPLQGLDLSKRQVVESCGSVTHQQPARQQAPLVALNRQPWVDRSRKTAEALEILLPIYLFIFVCV